VRRWLSKVMIFVSLVLFAASALMWGRSYYQFDRIELTTHWGELYAMESEAGALYVPLYDAGSRWENGQLSASSYKPAPGEGWANACAAWAGITVFRSGTPRILALTYWLLATISLSAASSLGLPLDLFGVILDSASDVATTCAPRGIAVRNVERCRGTPGAELREALQSADAILRCPSDR
jgi:hypothetical protein